MNSIPTAQKVCFSLLLLGSVLFYVAYYHSGQINDFVFGFSEKIAWVLSVFNPPEPQANQAFVGGGWSLYEDRAVLIAFSVSIFLFLLAFCLAIAHRLRFGSSRFFIPIVFMSITAVVSVVKLGYELGLHSHF